MEVILLSSNIYYDNRNNMLHMLQQLFCRNEYKTLGEPLRKEYTVGYNIHNHVW